MRNLIRHVLLSTATLLMMFGCSTATEDLTDAVGKQVEEEVNKVVDETVNQVRTEGKKKAEELLNEGTNKLNDWLGGVKTTEETNDTTDVLQSGGTTERVPVTLSSVADGDTATFLIGENKLKVRYLLVDSSEISKNQPFSEEAKARNKELLESGQITLEWDIGSRKDYDRSLNYVFVDNVSVQEVLLREGLVRIAYVTPPNTRYLDEFKAAEAEAKEKGIGIWSIENYATESGFKP